MLKKIFPTILVIVLLGSIVSPVSAASYKTGNFNDGYEWSGWTAVYSSNTGKACKIRIRAYDMTGRRTSGHFDVQVSFDGRSITQKDDKTNFNWNMSKGYRVYYVRIRKHNFGSGWINDARNFENEGKCVYWSIEGINNCCL